MNELLECFSPVLVDVFLCCSDDVFALAEDILHVGHVPYVHGLLARDKVRPDDVVVEGCCSAEVRYHEPAREDELRVCPERKPNRAFGQYGFINMHFACSLCSSGLEHSHNPQSHYYLVPLHTLLVSPLDFLLKVFTLLVPNDLFFWG